MKLTIRSENGEKIVDLKNDLQFNTLKGEQYVFSNGFTSYAINFKDNQESVVLTFNVNGKDIKIELNGIVPNLQANTPDMSNPTAIIINKDINDKDVDAIVDNTSFNGSEIIDRLEAIISTPVELGNEKASTLSLITDYQSLLESLGAAAAGAQPTTATNNGSTFNSIFSLGADSLNGIADTARWENLSESISTIPVDTGNTIATPVPADIATIVIGDAGSVTEANATYLTYDVKLSNAVGSNVEITLNTTGSATAGSDYKSQLQYSIDGTTWTNVPTTNKITLPADGSVVKVRAEVLDDAITESNETVILNATTTNAQITSSSDIGTGTIVDNEAPIRVLSVTSDTQDEGNSLVHTVTLSGVADSTKTYTYSFDMRTGQLKDIEAEDIGTISFSKGVTYNSTTGLLSVPAGVTSFTITTPAIDDSPLRDSGEFYTISVDGISGTGTIYDPVKIAKFTDNYVNGLEYTTSSGLTGLTGDAGANGSFKYRDGDTITFKIGNVTVATFISDAIKGEIVFIQDIVESTLSDVNSQAVENIAIFLQALDSDLQDSTPTDGILHTNDIVNSDSSYSSNINITQAIRDAFKNYIDPTTGRALNLEDSGKEMLSDALAKVGIEFTRESEASSTGENIFETKAVSHVVDTIEDLAGTRKPETFDERKIDIIEAGDSKIFFNFVTDSTSGKLVIKFNALDLVKDSTPHQVYDKYSLEVTDVQIDAKHRSLGTLVHKADGSYEFVLNEGVTSYDVEGLSIDYKVWDWTANEEVTSKVIDTFKSNLSADIHDVTEGTDQYNVFTLNSALTFDTDQQLRIVFTSENLSASLGKPIAEYGDDYLVPLEYSTDGGATWKTMSQTGIVYNEQGTPMPQFGYVLPANSASVQIRVPIFDDLQVESTEYFQAVVTGDNFYNETVEFKIYDNDPIPNDLPVIDIDYVYTVEGAENAVFTVTLDRASTETITVNYSTLDLTATNGLDYVGGTGTITFLPGETSKQIKFKIIDDLLDENLPDPEIALINLSNPTNAVLGDAQATLRIFDNDPIDDLPNVIVDDVSVVEGNVVEFKVSFDADLVMPMNVKLVLTSGSASIGVDFINSLSATYVNAAGVTKSLVINSDGDMYVPAGAKNIVVKVSTIDDPISENSETFTLTATTVKNSDTGTK